MPMTTVPERPPTLMTTMTYDHGPIAVRFLFLSFFHAQQQQRQLEREKKRCTMTTTPPGQDPVSYFPLLLLVAQTPTLSSLSSARTLVLRQFIMRCGAVASSSLITAAAAGCDPAGVVPLLLQLQLPRGYKYESRTHALIVPEIGRAHERPTWGGSARSGSYQKRSDHIGGRKASSCEERRTRTGGGERKREALCAQLCRSAQL